jgi:DNA primase
MDFAHLATQELAVSFSSSLDAKDLVRQAIDIVDLVGKHVQLRRQGRNYVGLCPWHDDSRPSLQVNPERQSFKCWVCDIGGDVFSFVMKMDGVTFPEALAMLADQAGIQLKPAKDGPRTASGGPSDKRHLYQAMAWAEKQYHECLLRDPEAEPARKYLRERGISSDSISRFKLGFAPNRWDWIQRRASREGFNQKTLETIGLIITGSEGGNPYDRFRGRVLFSIRDVQGRPVGMGGRVLPESGSTSPAKYINSPETPLFAKSSLLYGLDVARDPIRKSQIAVVMEGYTDCIMAHQHGFDNAVAALGTAVGSRHVQILKRFADRILLMLDGDEAGQRRTNEVLELFVAENVDLRILTLPENLDPCDFLKARGADAFRAQLTSGAVDALEHAFRAATRGIDVARDVHAGSEALERLLGIVAKAPRLRLDTTRDDRFREEKILQRLAASFRVPERDVRDRLTAMRRAGERRSAPTRSREAAPPSPAAAADPWERELLVLVMRHPECLGAARAAIGVEQIASAGCRSVYAACCRMADAGVAVTFERLMLEFDDPAVKSLLVELDETGAARKIADPQVLLEELTKSFERREALNRYPGTAGLLREGRLDESQELDLLRDIVQQERIRHGISAPTDG